MPDVLDDEVHDARGLARIRAAAAALVDAVLNVDPPHAGRGARVRAGEGDEVAAVEVGVGEGDERLVLAAVVPAQGALGHADLALVENALDPLSLLLRRIRALGFVLV